MERNIVRLKRVDSTNNEAARIIAHEGRGEGFYVITDYQEYGRGQADHGWVSEPGKNLLLSKVVFPAFLSVSDQFLLSKAVSLSIRDLLNDFSISALIKWPNDILTSSGKIAGILIENSLTGRQISHSIVGVGLNVLQKKFPVFPHPATSMALETGWEPVLSTVEAALFVHIEKRYNQLEKGESDPLSREYLEALYRLNEDSFFSDGKHEFRGMITGVNRFGELEIKTGQGIHSYGFHQVRMIH